MKAWRWNGAAYEPCDSLPLTDRGFRYGMSVFESLRVNADGVAEFFDKHLARLVQACAEREIPVEESALAAAQALLREAAETFLHPKESGASAASPASTSPPATAAPPPPPITRASLSSSSPVPRLIPTTLGKSACTTRVTTRPSAA